MQLTLDQKMACLKPGSIWRRRKLGQWQRVYLEAVQSKLLRDGSGFIDIRTEFGLEFIKLQKFLSGYEFLGWARVKLPQITSDNNLIPLMEDPSK